MIICCHMVFRVQKGLYSGSYLDPTQHVMMVVSGLYKLKINYSAFWQFSFKSGAVLRGSSIGLRGQKGL